MFLNYFYGYWGYLLFMLPAFLISMFTQLSVKTTFAKYSKIKTLRGMTGSDAAHMVLDYNNVGGVLVQAIRGNLTDNFDPRSNTISLSSAVYYNTTISAVSVAAHEAGHAVQHAYGYKPITIRSIMAPITQITSTLSFPLILLGFAFQYDPLVTIGILLFSFAVLFSIITLPVEFNASSRAIKTLSDANILTADELVGAKKMLRAAAMTYVASTFTALWSLLRLILLYGSRGRRN